jgi:hypothetical protein
MCGLFLRLHKEVRWILLLQPLSFKFKYIRVQVQYGNERERERERDSLWQLQFSWFQVLAHLGTSGEARGR